MAVESFGFSREKFLISFQSLFHTYERDDRHAAIFHNRERKGKEDSKRRALEKVLYASNLDFLNVSKESEILAHSQEIVDIAFQISPQALLLWWNDFKHPIAFSNDHTDKRVRMIIEIAEKKFREEGMI